jgi:tRNA(Ile)-lysidine synthase
MTGLEKKLRASWRRLGLGERAVLVAVSGGADSRALLDALVRVRGQRKLPGKVYVAHLNHLLRGEEAEGDEAFVRELAARLDVRLIVERVPVAEQARLEKRNLEATARHLRYAFLRRAAQSCGASVVATAHTRDDQIETILLRLLRGSSAEGLRGIHTAIKLSSDVELVRPLLKVTRAEVLAHCEHYGLKFRTDSSNLSTEFARNRVRHELLPLLRSFNPRFDAALIRAAEQITDDAECLNSAAAEIIATAAHGSSLDIQALRAAPAPVRRRALRIWLRAVQGDLRRIASVHLTALDKLVTSGRGGSYIELPGGWQAHRKSKRLVLIKAQVTNAATINCQDVIISRVIGATE